MIFNNIEFHNVAAITPDGNGAYALHRLSTETEALVHSGTRARSLVSTGVELRFKFVSDTVSIKLRIDARPGDIFLAHIYHGSALGPWQECKKYLHGGDNVITLNRPAKTEQYKMITESGNFPFSPDVIRIVFSYGNISFVGVDGECLPPSPEDLPKKTMLCYGSSITHGSSSLNIPWSFVFQLAEHFRVDALNLGFAGNCRLESAMADEIAARGERGEWDFATLCMGINILDTPRQKITELVSNMIKTVAGRNPEKHIFCLSPSFCRSDFYGLGLAEVWREVIEEQVRLYNSPFVHYVNGLDLIDGAWGMSGDCSHPAPMGIRSMVNGLIRAMEEFV